MNFEKIKEIIDRTSAEKGITEYEIFYMSSSSTSLEALGDEISSFALSENGGLCYRCVHNGAMGYASTQLMEEEEMISLVERAISAAENTEKKDEVGIYAGGEEYVPLSESDYEAPSAEEMKKSTLELQRAIYNSSEYVTDGTQAVVETESVSIKLANSHGVELSLSTGAALAVAVAIVKKDGQSEDSYEFAEYSDTLDMDVLASSASEKALQKIGASSVESGKYTLVISSEEMRSLLSVFSSAFSAKNAQLGLSLLNGKEGEKIASDIVSVIDDPMKEGFKYRINFDSEGVPTYKKTVIENGVLKTLLHNRETAKKAGVRTTANASKASYQSPVNIRPYAFYIDKGEYSLDGLFALAENGIYITGLSGLHAGANAVTGDFSLQSEGFLIENGKKASPVKTFTISGNFFELLKNIEALEDKIDFGVPHGFTAFGSPAALIRNMSVAGK